MEIRGMGPADFATRSLRLGAAVVALMLPSVANAGVVVAPNANTNVSGNAQQLGVLGRGNVTFQFAYDASQFSGVAVGTTLNGIGFRLPANAATISSPLFYSAFSVEVATAALPVSSLSATFAANQAGDNTVVFSGPLTIPAGALVGGTGPNPFYELVFTTPFTYQGGSLVVTLRNGNATDQPSSVFVDANSADSVAGIGNGLANFNSSTATTADGNGVGFYNVPIASFDFATVNSVPEPTTWVLASIALLPALAYRTLRRGGRKPA